MKKNLLKLVSDKKGIESMEVAVLIGVVVIVAIAAYTILGDKIAAVVTQLAGSF